MILVLKTDGQVHFLMPSCGVRYKTRTILIGPTEENEYNRLGATKPWSTHGEGGGGSPIGEPVGKYLVLPVFPRFPFEEIIQLKHLMPGYHVHFQLR